MKKLSVFLVGIVTSCASLNLFNNSQDKVLFTVDNYPVTTAEFTYAFNKNRPADSLVSQQDIDEYLDLYINFKLKVTEAKSRGMDTTASFKKELDSYIGQLDNSYLQTKNETDTLVKEAFARLQYEIRASHILFSLDESASPADTLAAYNKAIAVRDSILNGASFPGMARKYSDDPSAKQNNGDLGYFSVFQMVYPFETAAYQTNVGEVSMPVRSKFGYHLIKVIDKRPNPGKVRVAHIMIRKSNDARERAFAIYDQLKAGADWNQVCRDNSEDAQTASKGGVLAPFSRNQIVATFADAAFSLDEPGEISDPVQTAYGWHIIKLIEKLPVGDFAANETQLRALVKRDSRAEVSKQKLIERLAKENNFIEFPNHVQQIIAPGNHQFIKDKWLFNNDSLTNLILFKIEDTNYTATNYYHFIEKSGQQANTKDFLFGRYNAFKDEQIVAYEKAHLAEKYDDYNYLRQEYHDGILLFSIMEKEVWTKAGRDSLGLATFYQANKAWYKDTTKLKAAIFSAKSKATLATIKDSIPTTGAYKKLSIREKEALIARYNEGTPLSLHLDSGEFVIAQHPVLQKLTLPYKESLLNIHDTWFYVIPLSDPYQPLPMDEIRGKLIADYQQELEKRWLKTLKNKYQVEINEKVLKSIYKELEKQ